MKVVGFTEFGDVDKVVKTFDMPDPEPNRDEVRVRVVAAAVSPSDAGLPNGETAQLWRSMGLFPQANIYVAGYDAAGVVDAVGEDVQDVAVGNRVAILTTALQPRPVFGSHAEYVVVPPESVVRLRDDADLIAWSTLLMNAVTAHRSLDLLGLGPESKVLVTGAAGAVGGYAIQLAKLRGHRVVADAADVDRDLIAAFGADFVVKRGAGFIESVKELFPDGVDGAVDTALLGDQLVDAIRTGGTIATLRPHQGDNDRGVTWEWPFVPEEIRNRNAIQEIRDYAQLGQLALRVSTTYAPEQAAAAYGSVLRGGLRGRPVIVFDTAYRNLHPKA